MIFSFGAFLLVLVLFYYALILLSDTIILKINNQSKYSTLNSFLKFFEHDSVKRISGYTAFLISLWNFFAPDFGSVHGGLTLVGALVPSTILFLTH
ncbi:MAG: hypothetical protein ACRCTJ_02165 [Brevinema sp.]